MITRKGSCTLLLDIFLEIFALIIQGVFFVRYDEVSLICITKKLLKILQINKIEVK